MTLRLNKAHKQEIARKARALSPIHNQIKELIEERKLLAEKIRIESLGGAEKALKYQNIADKIIKLREELPENLLSYSQGVTMNNSIFVRTDNQYYSRRHLKLPKTAVVSDECYDMTTHTKYLPALLESIEKEDAFNKELSELYDNVYASISSITTVKKLLEQWEEAIELLPSELKQPKIQLPALQTHKLNKLIGLPTKKEK